MTVLQVSELRGSLRPHPFPDLPETFADHCLDHWPVLNLNFPRALLSPLPWFLPSLGALATFLVWASLVRPSLPLGSPHSIILFTDPRCELDYHSSLTGFCATFQALAAASRAGSSVWAGAW